MSKVLITTDGTRAIPQTDLDTLATKLGALVIPEGVHIQTLGETSREKAMEFAIAYVKAKNGSHPQNSIVDIADAIYQFLIKE